MRSSCEMVTAVCVVPAAFGLPGHALSTKNQAILAVKQT
jgi:hypothetical protein